MISRFLIFISLAFLLCQFAFSQIEESSVDFKLNPALILNHDTQVSYEWFEASDFNQRKMRVVDLVGVANLHPNNLQLVASKIILISGQTFDQLSYAKMNTMSYVSEMLTSVGIEKKSLDTWNVTNKVKAYGLSFKVNFNFQFRETYADKLPANVVNYLRTEASSLPGTGRERFLTLDMSNFSQLMYRNFSVVYLKELANHEILIVSGVVAGVDINKANTYFNHPPFAQTEKTMMNNMRRLISHMLQKLKGN